MLPSTFTLLIITIGPNLVLQSSSPLSTTVFTPSSSAPQLPVAQIQLSTCAKFHDI
ncbi:hypothetical protein BDV96DRAFT_566647 [Lophiotrema nucula]|uniref:Uncharacterized protein n=1 Tax=Lophiotrema nucula TaxID=690887 RepID=A0A6A5ZK91_9PLEO|nr:hypothetical protein BDV96DRAFT_566647 [Lophiotrema nucula]